MTHAPTGSLPSTTGALSPRDLLVSAAGTSAAAADQAGVQIRSLDTVEQMTAACRLLEQVWGVRQGQAFDVQPHLLRALGHGGNYLVGAYRSADGALVGASAAFFTEPLGAAMHSHITGVASGAAGRGVGAALKWHQRQWALERGLTTITWTFDPLIARNAHFNISRLGARPQTYYVDFYGVMDDGANLGQPSDRIEAVWDLSSAATVAAGGDVIRRADPRDAPVSRTGGPAVDEMVASGAQVLLAVGDGGQPVTASSGREADLALVAIPGDIEAMRRSDPQLALTWRYRLRATLALLMADRSWRVSGFVRDGWYVLSRESAAPRRTGHS